MSARARMRPQSMMPPMMRLLRGNAVASLVLGAFLVSLLSSAWDRVGQPSGPQRRCRSLVVPPSKIYEPIRRSDLLLVIPSTTERLPLVEASRRWRYGIRTCIILNAPLPVNKLQEPDYSDRLKNGEETWSIYPDVDNTGAESWLKKGDLRAGIAPFLANKTVDASSYKWILFGDDDTYFQVDNVIRVLERMDHTMPYFLTDAIWFPTSDGTKQHANRDAPRCLPCNYMAPLQPANVSRGELLLKTPPPSGFAAPPGCPCTPQVLCRADNLGWFRETDCDFTEKLREARIGKWYFVHGGAGTLISTGLMGNRTYEAVHQYLTSIGVRSGDSLLTMAMWNVFNIGPTDPGYGYHHEHIRMFDPGWRQAHRFDAATAPEDVGTRDTGNDPEGVLARLDSDIIDGTCDERCQEQLHNTLTVHIRSRHINITLSPAEISKYGLQNVPKEYLVAAYFQAKLAMQFSRFGRQLHRPPTTICK